MNSSEPGLSSPSLELSRRLNAMQGKCTSLGCRKLISSDFSIRSRVTTAICRNHSARGRDSSNKSRYRAYFTGALFPPIPPLPAGPRAASEEKEEEEEEGVNITLRACSTVLHRIAARYKTRLGSLPFSRSLAL